MLSAIASIFQPFVGFFPRLFSTRLRQTALKGAWSACSTFCQGVTAPPSGSTISARTPQRFAANTVGLGQGGPALLAGLGV